MSYNYHGKDREEREEGYSESDLSISVAPVSPLHDKVDFI